MIEFERMNLEKTMTIKLDRKKETLKRKLKEFERQATAELVEKQSREMLALISMKLEEYKEEQKVSTCLSSPFINLISSFSLKLKLFSRLPVWRHETRKQGKIKREEFQRLAMCKLGVRIAINNSFTRLFGLRLFL